MSLPKRSHYVLPILVNITTYHTDDGGRVLRITLTPLSYTPLPNSQIFHEFIYLFIHAYVHYLVERNIAGSKEKGDNTQSQTWSV